MTPKVKYADFNQITRSKTVAAPIADLEEIVETVMASIFPPRTGDRVLDVT